MLAITCDKCRRRYTATDDELRVYLHEAEGKKYAQVLCPHCGKPSKIAADRIHQALRFSKAPEESAATSGEATSRPASAPSETAGSDEETSGGEAAGTQGPAQEVNPAA